MTLPTTYNELVNSIQDWTQKSDADFIAAIPTFILFGQKRIARELKIEGLQSYVTGNFSANQGVVVKPARWLNTISINWGNGNGQALSVMGGGGTLYTAPLTFTFTPVSSISLPTFTATVINGVVTNPQVDSPGAGIVGPTTLTAAGFDGIGSGATFSVTVGTSDDARNFLFPRAYEYCRTYWPNPTLTGDPRFYADYGFEHWLIVPTPSAASPIEIAYYQLDNPLDVSNQTNWLTENASDLLLFACLLETAPYLKDDERIAMWQAEYDRLGKAYTIEDTSRVFDRTEVRKAS